EEYRGRLWIGTERGLVRSTGSGYEPVSLNPGGLDFVFSLKAAAGHLWIGTGEGVFAYMDGDFRNISLEEGLPVTTVYNISEGEDGSLWFATYTHGFFRYFRGEWTVLREMNGMRLDSLNYSCFVAVSAQEV